MSPYSRITCLTWFYAPDAERVARGLGMLHEICNMDKHRHLAIANVRWTGRYPRWVSLASFYPTPEGDEKAYLDIEALRLEAEDLLINHELAERPSVASRAIRIRMAAP